MAWVVTPRHVGSSGTTAVQTQTSSASTQSSSSFLLCGFVAEPSGTNPEPVIQGFTDSLGGTWTRRATAANGWTWGSSGQYALALAVESKNIGVPASMTITGDPYSGTQTAYCSMAAVDITGHSSSPIVQTKTAGATVPSVNDIQSGSITLDSAPTAGNLLVVFFSSGADSGGGFAVPTAGSGKNFTASHNPTGGGGYAQIGVFYRVADGTESATITCSDLGQAVGNYAIVAFELAPDGGVPPSVSAGQQPTASDFTEHGLWSSLLHRRRAAGSTILIRPMTAGVPAYSQVTDQLPGGGVADWTEAAQAKALQMVRRLRGITTIIRTKVTGPQAVIGSSVISATFTLAASGSRPNYGQSGPTFGMAISASGTVIKHGSAVITAGLRIDTKTSSTVTFGLQVEASGSVSTSHLFSVGGIHIHGPDEHPLWYRLSSDGPRSLVLRGGSYVITEYPSEADLQTEAYLGGRVYTVSRQKALQLAAAGYGDWLTPPLQEV